MAVLLFWSNPVRCVCLSFLPARFLLVHFHACSLLWQVRRSPSSCRRLRAHWGGGNLDANILTMCKLCLQTVVLRWSSYLTLPLRAVAAQSSRPAPSVYRRYTLPGVVASAAPRYIQQETLLLFLPLAFSHAAMLCLLLREICHHVERSAGGVLRCRGLQCQTFNVAPRHRPCVWQPCRIRAVLVMWLHMTIPIALLLLCGMCLQLFCLVSRLPYVCRLRLCVFQTHILDFAWEAGLFESVQVRLNCLMFFSHAAQYQILVWAVLPICHASRFAGWTPQTGRWQL